MVTAASLSAQEVTDSEKRLLGIIEKLEQRVAALEGKANSANAAGTAVTENPAVSAAKSSLAAITAGAGQTQSVQPQASGANTDFLHGTTVNLLFDGYYGYNFNNPVGRSNLLRAYDITSNGFSINQAALVLENAADPDHGKRFGARLDLQFGQATQTLQGNPANELRPEIYRNIFQLYGNYVAPLGKGVNIQFGKWASSIGVEGNYTKDQTNYSRSYWFSILPSYHTGVQVNYKLTDRIGLNYWVVNGTQQTEPFNNFKDELFGFTAQPSKKITWTVNYYLGQEHPDVTYFPNGVPANATQQTLPTIQGLPFLPITNAPKGKLYIIDSYATWNVNPKLTLTGEVDYVLQRLNTNSQPDHTDGGAVYARYQFSPRFALAGRAEYVSDKGGLYSGATQVLKEGTFTTEYRFNDQFLMRAEWRRDASNHAYFLTDRLGVLKKEQNTATLGLIWWYGGKQGPW